MKLTPVYVAAAMLSAVLCSHYFGAMTAAIVSGAVVISLFIVFSLIRHRPQIAIILLGIAFIAGTVSYSYSIGHHSLLNYIGKNIIAEGIVISNPQESRSSDNYKYTVRINSLTYADNVTETKDTVLLSTPSKLCCGDKIRLTGTIKDFPDKMNENGFDVSLYYRSQNIFTRIFSKETEITGQGFLLSPYFLSQMMYSKIDRVIYKYYHGDIAAMISAVLTGNIHNFSNEFYTILNNTALKRQLHPAYLHILIIMTLIGLLRRSVHKRLRNIAAILILGIYALFSCSNIGFTRCLVISAMMMFYREKDGSAYYPDALAKIIIFCILTTPMIVFNAVFTTSVVSGLMVFIFAPLIRERLWFVPSRFRRITSFMIICALFITPLCTIYFDSLCIYGFFTPLIMMPLVLVLLIMSPFVFLMLGIFGTAPLIGPCYDLLLNIALKLPVFIDLLPFSHIFIPKPSPAVFFIIISLIFSAYYYMKKHISKVRLFTLTASILTVYSAISLLLRIGTTDFTFVNVGQGDGSVIHTAYGATVIIDGGGGNAYSDYDPGESIFVPYLISKGYYNIDAAFISHFHKDHVQGIIAAINELNVDKVFYMSPLETEIEPSYWYEELKKAADLNGTELCALTENTDISFDCGLDFEVYLPDKTILLSGDENSNSLIIKASYGKPKILYTGDLSAKAERRLIKRGIDLDADVLKVAHHGSKTSASKEWVDAVSPDFAVISCGKNNTFGHPSQATLDTLKNSRVFRTDLDGGIRVTVSKKEIKKTKKFK